MELRFGDKTVLYDDTFEISGAVYIGGNGYPYTCRQLVHRLVAEKAIGRKLTKREHVHHVNYNKLDARGGNLVICEAGLHMLLHSRWDTMLAGFDWRTHSRCSVCQTYHPVEDFPKSKNAQREHPVHNICKRESNRIRKEKQYRSVWDWRGVMNQQFNRAIKKGVPLSVLPGRVAVHE